MNELEDFYSRLHACCVRLPADGSQWRRGADAASIAWAAAQRQTERKEGVCNDTAVRAVGRGITPLEAQASLGKFLDYCPVTFKEQQCLAKCAPGLGLAAEYRGQLYRTRNEECMQKFIANPGKYLNGVSLLAAPSRGRVPIPVPASEVMNVELALEGHCPVTLWLDPKDRKCVIPGSRQFQVQYGDLVFRMLSAGAQQAFLEKPWLYSDLILPAKMPAARANVPLDALPARGYCEQTLARSVTAALNALCEERPKYPGLTVEDSVLKYLALHMRANNKRENEEQHEQSQKLFDQYVDCCQLAPFLDQQAPETETYKEKQEKFEKTRAKPWELFMGDV